MFAKVCLLLLSTGLVACILLAVRQQRLDAVSAMSTTQLHMMKLDRDLNVLRYQIAASIVPQHVEALAAKIGDLKPIEVQPLVRIKLPAAAVVQARPRR